MTLSDKPVSGILSIEYCESTLTLFQQDAVVWETLLHFSWMELILTVELYLRYKRDLQVGEPMAETVVIELGSALPSEIGKIRTYQGRNLSTGLPRNIEVNRSEVREQIQLSIGSLVHTLSWMLKDPIRTHPMPQVPDHLREALTNSKIVISGQCRSPKIVASDQYRDLKHAIAGQYGWLSGLAEHLQNELGLEFIQSG